MLELIQLVDVYLHACRIEYVLAAGNGCMLPHAAGNAVFFYRRSI